MATPAIPTRIRQHIRDHIVSPTSALSTATASLTTTLGYPLVLEPEWAMFWTALKTYYPDQNTFVPSVAEVLGLWCRAFQEWLEEKGEDEGGQVERLLDCLRGCGGRLRLDVEISPTASSRPTTTWRAPTSSFVLYLPKSRPSPPQTVFSGLTSDFLLLFTASPSQAPVRSPGLPTTAAAADDPDAWAELDLDDAEPVRKLAVREGGRARGGKEAGDDFLPDVATLERPEEMVQRPPYRLVVRQVGSSMVEVQGSHQGSLRVLEGYLKQWVRHSADYVNKPALATITLRESLFGLGLLYDTLVIEAGRHKEVNAMLVLTLVENVLGYELLEDRGVAGGVWEFRRVRGFR